MTKPPTKPASTQPARTTQETPWPLTRHQTGTPEHKGFAKALAKTQRPSTEPAPTTSDDDRLELAFLWAIEAHAYLKGGEPELTLPLDGKEWSIREIADAASRLDGAMSDDICARLFKIATPRFRLQYLQIAEGKTFAAGGRCLRAMYDDLVKQRALKDK